MTDDLYISPCTRREQEDRLFCQVTTKTSERASDFTISAHAERKKEENVATAYVLRWKGQQTRGQSFFVAALGSYCFKRLICVNGFLCVQRFKRL
jgi:hypothetical protein